jgi:hypothetical protein
MMSAEGKTVEELGAAAAKYLPKLDLQTQIAHDVPMLPLAADPQDDPCTDNEGESTDAEEEAPADQSLRGQTCLVTAACPRQYPRELEARRAQRLMIPEDFGKEEFLTKFRRTLAKHSTVKLEKASCHSEPHKRISRTTRKRVRHYHLALKLSGNFAHKKVADAFYKEHGLRISFSFKSNRFVGNLAYLMDAGKKASTDLDLDPSVFPRVLHLKEELKARKHPDRPWHVPVTVDKDHTNTLPRATQPCGKLSQYFSFLFAACGENH